MKVVKAVSPHLDGVSCNFKLKPYEAWKRILNDNENVNANENKRGVAKAHYPWRMMHWLAHRWDLPTLWKSKTEARLRFVEASSIRFDTFPDYARYEIVPMVWDCWPQYDDGLVKWFQKHDVKTCVFTCREAAERIQKRLPQLNILIITEGIETSEYPEGLNLNDREIDIFLFGRNPRGVWKHIKEMNAKWGGENDVFHYRLQHSRVTLAFPQCDVFPEKTGGQETLTQRFWECMLSRTIMVGRAPKELVDLIGYNPVININENENGNIGEGIAQRIKEVLEHIEDYQELADRNRETALRMAPWEIRMKQVMEWLNGLGYEI